jgi:hypothetical protein
MSQPTSRNSIAAVVTGVVVGALVLTAGAVVLLFVREVTPDAISSSRILIALALLAVAASGIAGLLARRQR